MAEENVSDRLKRFIENKGLTYSQFADRCGIPRPSLSQLLTGRNKKINDTMVRQIHNEFPELSVVWLLFGEGEMENKPQEKSEIFNGDVIFFDDFSDSIDQNKEKSLNSSGTGLKPSEFSKENGAKNAQNSILSSDLERDRLTIKIKELTAQIEKLKKNPRKVAHITLYYDDSTFETFIPASPK